MAYSEEYRNLIVNARDSIRELLDGSTHDSWLGLRRVYGEIVRELERDAEQRPEALPAGSDVLVDVEGAAAPVWRGDDSSFRAWRSLPAAEREHRILNVLGDERLAASEIATRLTAEFGDRVVGTTLKPMLQKMLDRRELGQEKELRVPGDHQFRWLYCRRRPDPSQLGSLEASFDQPEGA